jgi:hypothetical protein
VLLAVKQRPYECECMVVCIVRTASGREGGRTGGRDRKGGRGEEREGGRGAVTV